MDQLFFISSTISAGSAGHVIIANIDRLVLLPKHKNEEK